MFPKAVDEPQVAHLLEHRHLAVHHDPVRSRGLCDAYDHLLDHQIADPVHELHDPLLGVLQADLARVQPSRQLLDDPLGTRYKFMTLHGLPAFCSDLLGQVGLFRPWSQWSPVSAFPPLPVVAWTTDSVG